MFTDIDECQTGNNNCHMNATCRNEAGSILCICNANSEGDGITCSGITLLLLSCIIQFQLMFCHIDSLHLLFEKNAIR
jgi:hypothetical protein